MEGLERIIREHAFFKDLDPRFVALVVGCAKNVRFEAGEYLFREGGPADQFYLLRHGRARAPLGLVLHHGLFAPARRPRARFGEIALPPVDDAQARHLGRAVRLLGMRRLRPLHHLVPGGHRPDRGSARHPCRRPRPPTRPEGGERT